MLEAVFYAREILISVMNIATVAVIARSVIVGAKPIVKPLATRTAATISANTSAIDTSPF